MRIYLDTCCYNRPYDDQSQDRVHLESEAILSILHQSLSNGDTILGSDVLHLEIERISDPYRRFKVSALYQSATESIPYDATIKMRAAELQSKTSIRALDSLHIASAEQGHAQIFLTTDDKLVRACRKISLSIKVMNPVSFLAEVIEHDGREHE